MRVLPVTILVILSIISCIVQVHAQQILPTWTPNGGQDKTSQTHPFTNVDLITDKLFEGSNDVLIKVPDDTSPVQRSVRFIVHGEARFASFSPRGDGVYGAVIEANKPESYLEFKTVDADGSLTTFGKKLPVYGNDNSIYNSLVWFLYDSEHTIDCYVLVSEDC